MSIDQYPPLSKKAGLAVTLAIVGLAWYGINNCWLDVQHPTSSVESRNTDANSSLEPEGAREDAPHETNTANDLSISTNGPLTSLHI
jgi:hypothetical protein